MTGHNWVFLIGAHKAGTTSLAAWLDQFRNVSVAASKEPNVFSRRAVASRSDEYFEEFDLQSQILVDASTEYSQCGVYPGTAARIASFASSAKIVYLTRDPMKRLVSAWRQHVDESGYVISRDFAVALTEDAGLVDATRYESQLLEYEKYFGKNAIYSSPMEALLANNTELVRLLRFLGIEQPCTLPHVPTLNSGPSKQADKASVGRFLDSRVGQKLAGSLRRTPLGDSLGRIRRRALMTDTPSVEHPLSLTAIHGGMLRNEAEGYLQHVGADPEIWPSLALP